MSELEQVAFAAKMHDFIEEVVPYLHPEQRLDVRQQGLDVLLSQTQVMAGINDEDLISVISAVSLCLDKTSMLASALTLLVNVSAECGHIFQEYDMGVIYRHCYKALKMNNSVDLVLMFLTNVTTMEKRAKELLMTQDEEDMEKEKELEKETKKDHKDAAVPSVTLESLEPPPPVSSFATYIISKSLEYNPQIEPDQLHGSLIIWEEIDAWQYSSNILCNLR